MTLAQRRTTWSVFRARWWPNVRGFGCRATRLAGFLPVVFVAIVMSLAYFTAVPASLVPMLRQNFSVALILLILFHFVFLNVVVNYTLLVYADPGGVPPDWSARPSTLLSVAANPADVPPNLLQSQALYEDAGKSSPGQLQRPHGVSNERFAHGSEEDHDIGSEQNSTARPLVLRRQDHASTPTSTFPYLHLMEERTIDGNMRYCHKCNQYKPDRSHHCSVCGRCILRMDHHCVFINNCVGFLNHKFFLCFVTYAFVGCFFVCVIGFPGFIAAIGDTPRQLAGIGSRPATSNTSPLAVKGGMTDTLSNRSPAFSAVFLVGYILTSAFAFALGIFVLFHSYLMFRGKTTIEMYDIIDPVRAARVARYDLGTRENFRFTCGSVPMYWFLPTRYGIEGDGLSFPKRPHETNEVGANFV